MSKHFKSYLHISGCIFISFVDLLGHTREEATELLKGLIGTDLQKLGQLNSRDFMNAFAINEEFERAVM